MSQINEIDESQESKISKKLNVNIYELSPRMDSTINHIIELELELSYKLDELVGAQEDTPEEDTLDTVKLSDKGIINKLHKALTICDKKLFDLAATISRL